MITAHITVGNHSHSQAQRSIEKRFNPIKNIPDADNKKLLQKKQQDIKIEDDINLDDQSEFDGSF